ncbi:MAG: Gfo/Idh/MocA family oxidoreductase [Pseudomonadota bacterium]
MKVGVIGVGSMGRNHARVCHDVENLELVAISDVNQEAVDTLAKKYRCKAYTDYEQMINENEFDMVIVVVPTSLHKEVSLKCIEKGINLLIEKPIASTDVEGQEILNFAEEKGVQVMIGHIERFNPVIAELRKRLKEGELGKIFKIAIDRIGPFPARIRDVGVIIDLAVHDLDIIRFLTDAKITRLYAETGNKINTDNEDLLEGTIRLDNDIICTLNINWLTPTKMRKIFVTGAKGMFVADYLSQNLLFFENKEIDKDYSYTDMVRGVSEGVMIRYNINKYEPLMAEIKHFADCIKNDTKPLITGYDGLTALKLAQDLKKSAELGEVVKVNY